MAAPRFLTALRKVAHFIQDFSQCRAAYELDVRQCRAFSTGKKTIVDEIDNDGATVKKHRSKTVPIPKITLLSPDGSIMVTQMDNAQRLAKHRNLHLVKVSDIDGKTQRPTYKLMSSSAFSDSAKNVEDIDNTKEKYKEIKVFYISAKIAEYDVLIKMKYIMKLLKKSHKVKIVINLDDIKEDKTQSIIENALKDYGSVRKMQSKKNVILLIITPLLNKGDDSPANKNMTSVSTTISQSDNT